MVYLMNLPVDVRHGALVQPRIRDEHVRIGDAAKVQSRLLGACQDQMCGFFAEGTRSTQRYPSDNRSRPVNKGSPKPSKTGDCARCT